MKITPLERLAGSAFIVAVAISVILGITAGFSWFLCSLVLLFPATLGLGAVLGIRAFIAGHK